MAFTYLVPAKVNNIAVGDQVVFAVAADGHAYVNATPTTAGATYPTVRAIFPAVVPPGTDSGGSPVTSAAVLWTVQLNGSAFSLPIDFTINATSDWVVRATGTA